MDWLLLDGALDDYGIRPREQTGLHGILLAPFLLLGSLVVLRRTSDFFLASAVIIVISGLGVWLTGPAHSVHAGPSGLVFGYLGFLLLRGFFERGVVAILVAIVVGAVYAGALPGLLPGQPGISWQGHLFGFVGGVLAARVLSSRGGGVN